MQGGCSPRGSELGRPCPRPLPHPRQAILPTWKELPGPQYCLQRRTPPSFVHIDKPGGAWESSQSGRQAQGRCLSEGLLDSNSLDGRQSFLSCPQSKLWAPPSAGHLGRLPRSMNLEHCFGATQMEAGSFSVGSPALASLLGPAAPVGSWFLHPE